MPAGQGKDAERFAAAVESGTPLGAAGDDDLAHELEIVAMLRSRGAEFAPDAETKARAKQRLMAVLAEQGGPQPGPRPAPQDPPHRGAAPPTAAELTAPLGRLVEPTGPEARADVDPAAQTARIAPITARMDAAGSESASDTPGDHDPGGEDAPTTATHQASPRAGRRARHSTGRGSNRPAGRAGASRRPAAPSLRRRALLVGSAAMVAMLAIAGGGIFASQGALPGDNLYAVKRAAESAGLALTFDDASRAQRQLEIAATRLSEVERLSALEPQAAPAPEVFTAAMDEFDAATDEGSRLLLESTGTSTSSSAQDELRTWASEQSERLTEIRPELPAAAEADESIELLQRLLGRTGAADGSSSCDDEECTARRSAQTSAPESDEADATEDATSAPDESDSSGTRETDEPSRTPSDASEGEESRLLPDLLPDADRKSDEDAPSSKKSEDEDRTSESESESESGDEGSEGAGDVSVPLPLLPPVTLPPLLPGMPGITIG
ncbi:DUF5667 domain-containing protein [Pseudonocardia kunmingensis]|uniref:DUF5667 domain-containing protein n=1 Tax=Pseudonocardia kunmingensis TaxID=630975 RepID=A0A543E1Y7_9PSEU|nr:DUF5667 domain-containing protein [Pseudonocardia kunmingensis]TQM15598.1 hypothetical protein FB558_2388 [Pseudonocardia kunmingensis]